MSAMFLRYDQSMESPKFAPIPAWLNMDERLASRLPADLPITAESNVLGEIAVTIADISPLGALIRTPLKLTIGSFVTLKINGAMTYGGWIAWAKVDSAGVDFANPVPVAIIDHLRAI